MKAQLVVIISALLIGSSVPAQKHLEIMVPDLKDTDLKGPVKSVDLKVIVNVSGQVERELSVYDETGNLLNSTEWSPDGEMINTQTNFYDDDGNFERQCYMDFENEFTNNWTVILNPETRQIAMKNKSSKEAAVYTYSEAGYLKSYRYVDREKKMKAGSITKRDENNRSEEYNRLDDKKKPVYTYWFKWREDGLIDRERQKYRQEKGERLHIYEYRKFDDHSNWTQRLLKRYDIGGREKELVYERLVIRDLEYFGEENDDLADASSTNQVELGEVPDAAGTNAIAAVGKEFSSDPEHPEKAEKKKATTPISEMLLTGRTSEELKGEFDYTFDEVSDKLVIISCDGDFGKSAGSGFIAKMNGKTYLFTNQHVIMGADTIRLRTAGGETITPRGVELSSKRDIARILIEDRPGFEVGNHFSVGSPLAVFGNSEGAGVATELYGEVTGLGADLVEVNAEFVSGNSGSPVLNTDQEVIGIASYVRVSWHPDDDKKENSEDDSEETEGEEDEEKKGDKFKPKTRRFCYRLDDLKWKKVRWKVYNEDYGKLYRETDTITINMFDIISVWINNVLEPIPQNGDLASDLKRWISTHNRIIERKKNNSIGHSNFINEYAESLDKLAASCDSRAWSMAMMAKKKELSPFMREEFQKNAVSLKYAGYIIKNISKEIESYR